MGPKITIDCATLMNKGLEIIEAMRLYDLPLEQVTALIHRQSIVHSMVEFKDGAVMAQLGAPDMRIPISLALTYPERKQTPAPALDLLSCPPLTFAEIDEDTFDCFRLAKQAAKRGGTVCAAMNAANEEAVALYLQDKISFYDISELVARAMELPSVEKPALRDILAADKAARELVRSELPRLNSHFIVAGDAVFMYILIAILMFGFLIFIHELGHFISAKLLDVQVNEFAICMGPVLWQKKKGETTYSLRAIPIGGFCAMEGEDEESDNPRAFPQKSWWRRLDHPGCRFVHELSGGLSRHRHSLHRRKLVLCAHHHRLF